VNLFQIALLTIALTFDLSGICLASGFALRKADAAVTLRLLLVLLLTQIILSFAGFMVGTALSGPFGNAGDWIALILFTGIGIKILYELLFPKPGEKIFETPESGTLVRLALASSVNSFVITMGIGFLSPDIPMALLVFSILMLISSATWLYIGRTKGPFFLKTRVGALGGLILVAAGLHLFIKLI